VASTWRWLAVLTGTALLVALPPLVARLPAPARDVPAATLLARIQHSSGVGYSGYAESVGGLALPVTSQFGQLADLFGGQTRLRVWWRSGTDWRVDSLGYTGETDVHTTDTGFWTWNYESNAATFTGYTGVPRIRLPVDADLLPPQLGRRLLSEVTAGQVSRLPTRRVAGVVAAGLRVRPSAAESTVDHVDVWADPGSGLPLSVGVYGRGGGPAALRSSFLDVTLGSPDRTTTAFTVPAGATLQSGPTQDLATVIDQLGGAPPAARLAGLDRNPDLPTLGSIGVYGSGVTVLAAVPLPDRVAYSLHHQLKPTPDDPSLPDSDTEQVQLSAGPLNLLLTPIDFRAGAWLLVGTVTARTLQQAGRELTGSRG